MKVSINWLKQLIDLKVSVDEVIRLLPLRTVGIKEEIPESFELDMKGYNRADLLSMRGVAYEIAAITNSEVTFQENTNYVWKKSALGRVGTEVDDSNLAPVYCLAKIEGLKVDKSPTDWIKKLDDSGMRSVNNIADVTNLIMIEYGQPLHSFDADIVKDGKIIVRRAKEGEEIMTLDNKKRKLETSDLLITDPEKALGIAGVMGGKNSEVSDSTTTILLEAAIFDPVCLRQTATRLNLPSEASKRFQHGLTTKRLLQALDAAIRMYQSLGGKLTAISLIGDLKDEPKTIELNQEKINSLIGVEIPPEKVESSLKALGFKLASHSSTHSTALSVDPERVEGSSGNVVWEVSVPYFRLDIQIEEDLIEEVARMYGYEKIPAKELVGQIPKKIDQSYFELIYKLKTTLVNLGLTEIQTYSFYSTKVIENLKLKTANLIHIANPMSSETEYLRDSLWPNLLEVTAKNIRNGIKDVAIFEIGKAYWQEGEEPKEDYRLSIALSNGTDNPIQELHQIYQALMANRHSGEDQNPVLDSGVVHDFVGTPQNDNFFHPTRFTFLEKDGKQIGWIAEVHPRIVNKFGTDQRVAVLETEIS